jgi:hypothetical protein
MTHELADGSARARGGALSSDVRATSARETGNSGMTSTARRLLIVIPILAASTALAARVVGALDGWSDDRLSHLTGLRFVIAVSLPLFVINRWRRLNVAPPVAAAAGLLISLSFPVLLWGGLCVAAPIAAVLRALDVYSVDACFVPAMMITSALGARFVAIALRKVTGRHDRTLRWAMVIWGGCWPLLQFLFPASARGRDAIHWLFPKDHHWLGPVSILLWQIPIGVACAIWFLRCDDPRRPAEYVP